MILSIEQASNSIKYMNGQIFDIQRFSLHDGPGIRTDIFLKGCPLRCKWCCNPESMNPSPVLMFNPDLCIGCGNCIQVCPTGAASDMLSKRGSCINCGACAEVCYAEARIMKGRTVDSHEVMREILKDANFYKRTNGGVTFSGGEPLLQIDFLHEVLKECRRIGINTAIETCGCIPWDNFERIAGLVDVFLFDIKHIDSEKHKQYTGHGCENIMANCEKLARIADVIIRVPVIPDFNYDIATLTGIVRFAERIHVSEIDFLPYHRYAENKYIHLGRVYWNPGISHLTADEIRNMISTIATGIKLKIGG